MSSDSLCISNLESGFPRAVSCLEQRTELCHRVNPHHLFFWCSGASCETVQEKKQNKTPSFQGREKWEHSVLGGVQWRFAVPVLLRIPLLDLSAQCLPPRLPSSWNLCFHPKIRANRTGKGEALSPRRPPERRHLLPVVPPPPPQAERCFPEVSAPPSPLPPPRPCRPAPPLPAGPGSRCRAPGSLRAPGRRQHAARPAGRALAQHGAGAAGHGGERDTGLGRGGRIPRRFPPAFPATSGGLRTKERPARPPGGTLPAAAVTPAPGGSPRRGLVGPGGRRRSGLGRRGLPGCAAALGVGCSGTASGVRLRLLPDTQGNGPC